MRKQVTIISPVYNEEAVIESFYRELSTVATSLQTRYSLRFVFVVDRSTDATIEVLRGLAGNDPRISVISLSSRFGHQMSLLAGIDHADPAADALIMMDCDLQHPPQVIPRLLEQFELGNDVVFTVREDTAGQGWLRKMIGNGFYRMLSALSKIPIHENAADFRLISGRVAKLIRSDIRERGLFLRGIFSWIGFRQVGVRFRAGERAGGRSKYTLSRMLSLASAGILSFSTRPLHLGLFVGIAFGAVGALMALWVFAEYFLDSSIPSGWTTLAMLQLTFSAVQLFCMGVLGVYIGGIYEQVRGRPHYIVDEIIRFDEAREMSHA